MTTASFVPHLRSPGSKLAIITPSGFAAFMAFFHWRTACSVCDRITQSNEASANSDSPLSKSTCSTLTSFATQAMTLPSSISTP